MGMDGKLYIVYLDILDQWTTSVFATNEQEAEKLAREELGGMHLSVTLGLIEEIK